MLFIYMRFLNKNMGVVNDLVTVDFGAMRHPTSVFKTKKKAEWRRCLYCLCALSYTAVFRLQLMFGALERAGRLNRWCPRPRLSTITVTRQPLPRTHTVLAATRLTALSRSSHANNVSLPAFCHRRNLLSSLLACQWLLHRVVTPRPQMLMTTRRLRRCRPPRTMTSFRPHRTLTFQPLRILTFPTFLPLPMLPLSLAPLLNHPCPSLLLTPPPSPCLRNLIRRTPPRKTVTRAVRKKDLRLKARSHQINSPQNPRSPVARPRIPLLISRCPHQT